MFVAWKVFRVIIIIYSYSQYLLVIGFYLYQSALGTYLPYYSRYPCHGFFLSKISIPIAIVASTEAIKSLKVFLLLVVDIVLCDLK